MPVKRGLIQLYSAKDLIIKLLTEKVQENRSRRTTTGEQVLEIAGVIVPTDEPEEWGRPSNLYENTCVTPTERLWLAVLEQTMFDAYLHSTGGNYQSIAWVNDARGYFQSRDFDWICEQLGLEPDWVRGMTEKLEQLAKKLRGHEYHKTVRGTKL